jgi:hypothetical protein
MTQHNEVEQALKHLRVNLRRKFTTNGAVSAQTPFTGVKY